MKKTDIKLADVFDLEPIPSREVQEVESEDATEDIDVSRKSLKKTLRTAEDALDDVLEIARSSENVRAFEVVGQLVKAISEVNDKLIDIHEKKSRMKTPLKEGSTTNNLFVGSTDELKKLIRGVK